MRLLETNGLECDESVLTGESAAAAKTAAPGRGDSVLDLASCAFMGTVVRRGEGRGVVVQTGPRTAFGRIALRLAEHHEQTAFQRGLQDYARMLVSVTALLAGAIFVLNGVLGRSLLQSLLFALAISVGMTPQLLPAIVTVSLASGARRLVKRSVVVKRLVAIEDLGNIEVLFTDKTGTLTEGRITFAQSSNFGNMFSAAGASLRLSFLPMLPGQILLNNLLYDVSELTIPTDTVDEELLARPSQWDIGFIRRFMALFGPISSIYDFATFAVMLYLFESGPNLFRSGWFVESLATQTLVIFLIRTRRVPFVRSRPSRPLLMATLLCAALAVAIPYSPLADLLGFTSPPLDFLGVIALMVVTYLALVEVGKLLFFRHPPGQDRGLSRRVPRRERRIQRRAAGWSHSRRDVAPQRG